MLSLPVMTMKKSRKITVIIISTIASILLVTGIVVGGFAFYLTSSQEYCNNYAHENEKKVASPNDMTNHLFYASCMEAKGLKSFGV